jgi:xanthine dehydrogenase accessory factor
VDESFEILAHAAELRRRGEPFALATVTVSQRPTSARVGSKAVVTADGALFGWVGGACAQPNVVAHAIEALQSGEPRVVRISPEPGAAREGIIELAMTCHSGGTLEVFIEPFIPEPYLVVIGDSPIARALLAFGGNLAFHTVAMAGGSGDAASASASLEFGRLNPARRLFVVVAGMGDIDEIALYEALAAEPAYLALVGSRRRFDAIADYLRSRGVTDERIETIRAPAGLNIRAETPAEIAVSILAEIIEARRTAASGVYLAPLVMPQEHQLVVDPICGMTVDLSTAVHVLELDGEKFAFCCAGCQRAFERERAAN